MLISPLKQIFYSLFEQNITFDELALMIFSNFIFIFFYLKNYEDFFEQIILKLKLFLIFNQLLI